jgi:hypothetical protein
MLVTIKEVASLISMQLAMSKYFPSIEKFYDAIEAAERTTTGMIKSVRKRISYDDTANGKIEMNLLPN